jgi:hypothetical protein
MDKLKIDTNAQCSNCQKQVSTGYIVMSPKGNKFLCESCNKVGGLKKQISITVRECTSVGYCIMRIFGCIKVYEVLSQKNIQLPEFIPESIVNQYLNESNINVTIK